MGKTLKSAPVSGLTVLVIMASLVVSSCTMPNDNKPAYIGHSTLNVVSANGGAHWFLADEGVLATLTDSLVIFANGDFLLYKVKYDGSNLTQLYPSTLWDDHFLSPGGEKYYWLQVCSNKVAI